MNLNCDESYNLLSLDLGQVAANHLREFVQHGDLCQKVGVNYSDHAERGGINKIKNI